jgi:hypothetical protein
LPLLKRNPDLQDEYTANPPAISNADERSDPPTDDVVTEKELDEFIADLDMNHASVFNSAGRLAGMMTQHPNLAAKFEFTLKRLNQAIIRGDADRITKWDRRLGEFAVMHWGPEEGAKLSDHGRYVRDAIDAVELVTGMTSRYLKCDGCGAVIDRRPAPNTENGGTYHWSQTDQLKRDAQSQGWTIGVGGVGFPYYPTKEGKDYCPRCKP